MKDELLILSWKLFYHQMLPINGNRVTILTTLKSFQERFKPYIEKLQSDKAFNSVDFIMLNSQITGFLKTTFPSTFLKEYNKVPPLPVQPLVSTGNQNADNLWNALNIVKNITRNHSEKKVHEYLHKYEFLTKTYDCLKNYGLHPKIENRDEAKYKRYNVIVEYAVSKKETRTETILLIPYDKLQVSFLSPYLSEKNILINGRKVLSKQTFRLIVTTSLLWDDEIENFKILKGARSDESFARECKDETNRLLDEWRLKNEDSSANTEYQVPFIGKLLDNLNLSSVVLDAFFSLVPQPTDRSQILPAYLGKLHQYNFPFKMKVYGAYPLMTDWELLEGKMKQGHFTQYNITQPEIEEYLEKYGKAFIEGYFSFEKDIVNKDRHLFNEPSDRQQIIFDYATGSFAKGNGFAENFGQNVHVLSSWSKAGKQAGYFYRAWFIILEYSKRFESFFKSSASTLPDDFTQRIIEGIRNLQTADDAEPFILEAKKGTKKDEAAFRKWFKTFLSGRYNTVEAEPLKGFGRIDLKIKDHQIGTKIIEFKGWWNRDVHAITKQINSYLTDFEDTGYIILINNLKRKDIVENYKSKITGEGTFYKPGSWAILEYQKSGYYYYRSQHRYGNKLKTIYHFIYRLFP